MNRLLQSAPAHILQPAIVDGNGAALRERWCTAPTRGGAERFAPA
jgi:hypothetical protein